MFTMRKILCASIVAAACALPAAARADVTFTPFVSVSFSGDTNNNRGGFGGSLSFMGSVAGLELDFGHTPNFFGDDSIITDANATTMMANLKFAPHITDRGVQPYVSGGVGLLRTRIKTEALFDEVTSNDWGVNIGFGVGGYFSDHVGLQGDIRYFRAFQDIDVENVEVNLGSFDFWRGYFGLSFKF